MMKPLTCGMRMYIAPTCYTKLRRLAYWLYWISHVLSVLAFCVYQLSEYQ